MTATLLQGETEVATATYDMTVTPPPPPSLEFQYLPSTLESGSDVFFRVNAIELESANSYTVKVTTDNADLGYNRDCTTRQYSEMAPAGRTSYTAYFVLYACASPGGTVTATLLEGTTEVATATQDVEGDNMTVEITGLLSNQVKAKLTQRISEGPLSASFSFD